MATNKDFKVKNGLVAGSTITAPSLTIGSDASSIAGDLTISEGKKIYFDSTDTYIGADTDTVEDLHLGADGNISLDPDGDVIIRVGSGTEYVRFDGSTQRVGIGTTSPGIALDVRTGSQYTNTYKAHLSLIDTQTAYDGSNPGGAVIFGGLSDSSSTNSWWAKIAGEKANNTDSNRSGILNFYTREEGGNPTQRMRIKEDGQVLIGKTASVASIDRKLEVEGTIAAASGSSGGVGFHMQNSEGEFLIYTDGGALVVKDYAGSDTYPFKIEGAAQNDTLVVNTGGDVTVKDALTIGSEIIHSGDTNNKIAFGTDTQTFTTAGSARMTIEADGDIAMTEDLDVAKHFSFDTQHVGGSAGGSTGTEDGANTWCKILSWDPGTTQYRDLNVTLGITAVDIGSQNQAIINVYGRSNGTNSAHTMGVKVISLISTHHLQDDSFKLITEGWGQPIELWMKKFGTYGTYNWNEIAKKVANNSTLTYYSNSAWQSTEPVKTGGTPAATTSYGVVYETRNPVLSLYHNQNVSGLSAGDVLSTISFRKHTTTGGNETIRIYNVQGDSGSSGASDDYHTSDLRISTRKIGTNSYTDRFTILGQEGYVGIGTMSPGSPLHLTSGSGYLKFDTSGSVGSIKSDFNLDLYADDGGNNSASYQNVRFFTAGSNERMRIDSAGNVGIGTTSPNQPLTVEGTMSLKEQASANADTAAYGQLWVKTATPNELYFTTDAGNDIQLTSGTSIAGGGGGAVSAVANGSNNRIATFSSADALNGEANLTFNGSTLTVTGAISATTKSFDIEHPTKEGMRLHHGSLEGPEHGVYVRGVLRGDTIELPDYWTGLVDEDTITVQLTANKTFQQLYVDTVKDNKVHVKELTGRNIDCFYFVQAERKDTGRMLVEY